MPEQNRSVAESKAQQEEFMNLLASGAHLDDSILPVTEYIGPVTLTPVDEHGHPVQAR